MKVDYAAITVMSRMSEIDYIKSRIKGIDVVVDDRGFNGGGNCWYNSKRAWTRPHEEGVTHRCVVQDDVELCNDFEKYVEKCVSAFPDAIWTFYNGRAWIKPTYRKTNSPYIRVMGSGMGGVAICMPIKDVQPMINFSDEMLGTDFIHDDTRVCIYSLLNDIPLMGTIPGLTNHKAHLKSTIPHHGDPRRVSSTFQFDVSGEDWNDLNYSETPWVTNDIWLPKGDRRKLYVEKLVKQKREELRRK